MDTMNMQMCPKSIRTGSSWSLFEKYCISGSGSGLDRSFHSTQSFHRHSSRVKTAQHNMHRDCAESQKEGDCVFKARIIFIPKRRDYQATSVGHSLTAYVLIMKWRAITIMELCERVKGRQRWHCIIILNAPDSTRQVERVRSDRSLEMSLGAISGDAQITRNSRNMWQAQWEAADRVKLVCRVVGSQVGLCKTIKVC